MANAERCVCCGEIIPEGRMVCPNCEVASKGKRLIAFDPITFESFTRHATKHREPDANPYDMGYVDAVEQIDDWMDANTVDAVEVVRCKDCKKYRTDSCAMSYTDRNEEMPHCWSRTNDFCSYGERKDKE